MRVLLSFPNKTELKHSTISISGIFTTFYSDFETVLETVETVYVVKFANCITFYCFVIIMNMKIETSKNKLYSWIKE